MGFFCLFFFLFAICTLNIPYHYILHTEPLSQYEGYVDSFNLRKTRLDIF